MKELRKSLTLDKQEFYETHLNLINCILPVKMTPMEIKVLAAFMGLEGDIAQYRFGPSAKKIVMSQCEITPAGLSNYISSLTTKGFLSKSADIINILPLLTPHKKEQIYSFKLINQSDETGTINS